MQNKPKTSAQKPPAHHGRPNCWPKNYATVFSSSLPIRRSSSSMSFFLAKEGFFVPFTYAANRG